MGSTSPVTRNANPVTLCGNAGAVPVSPMGSTVSSLHGHAIPVQSVGTVATDRYPDALAPILVAVGCRTILGRPTGRVFGAHRTLPEWKSVPSGRTAL